MEASTNRRRRLLLRHLWRQNLLVAKLGTIAALLLLALTATAGAQPRAELSATLSAVSAAEEQGTPRAAVALAAKRGVDVRGDDLLVLVQGDVADVPRIETSLRELGAQVHLSLRGVVQARLPVS